MIFAGFAFTCTCQHRAHSGIRESAPDYSFAECTWVENCIKFTGLPAQASLIVAGHFVVVVCEEGAQGHWADAVGGCIGTQLIRLEETGIAAHGGRHVVPELNLLRLTVSSLG